MKLLLDGFNPSDYHIGIGRYRFLEYAKKNFNLHNHEIVTEFQDDVDLILCESVFGWGRAVRYLHAIGKQCCIPKIRCFVHAMDTHTFWSILKGMPGAKLVSPHISTTDVLATLAPSSFKVMTVPWPVYPLPASMLTITKAKPVVTFFGRIDAALKFDILHLLKSMPTSFFKDYDVNVVGSTGNLTYMREVNHYCTQVGAKLRSCPSDAALGNALKESDFIFCLSTSPQESFGLAPREALYTDAIVVTTAFGGFNLLSLGQSDGVYRLELQEAQDAIPHRFGEHDQRLEISRHYRVDPADVMKILASAQPLRDRAGRDRYLGSLRTDFAEKLAATGPWTQTYELKLGGLLPEIADILANGKPKWAKLICNPGKLTDSNDIIL